MSTHPNEPDDNGGLDPPTPDLLAGEYVHGVLSAEERRRLHDRVAIDPEFSRRRENPSTAASGSTSGP